MERTKDELKDKHWSELLTENLLETKKPPFVITGGMTTSGSAHLGTVMEFLYSSMVKQVLENQGYNAPFYFIGDIYDAFDKIPKVMKTYERELTPHLGKPLSNVPDPLGCHKSYGEHFLSEAIDIMQKMNLKVDVKLSNELYAAGVFDPFAKIFLEKEDRVKEVIAKTSFRKIEDFKDWSPIMPICSSCGKIATTRVIWHDSESYEYVCDKKTDYTTGCGYSGKAKLTDHMYKLQWRLHWPAWQTYFKSSMEGSGVDHMTRGGSADTAIAIHREILSREPPLLYKFGFMLFHGKKASKSSGNVMEAAELMSLMPPEVLKYILIAPNVEQDKDFDPTGDNLIAIYDEIERLGRLEKAENRADEKKLTAFRLAVKKLKWKASFTDMLLNYQIYRDWKRVGELLNDVEGIAYLAPYITEWLKRDFEPERYNFSIKPQKITELKDVVIKLSESLDPKMDDLAIHNLIYSIAKANNIKPEQLFQILYQAIIGKEKGPRLGKLIASIGIAKVKEMLNFAAS